MQKTKKVRLLGCLIVWRKCLAVYSNYRQICDRPNTFRNDFIKYTTMETPLDMEAAIGKINYVEKLSSNDKM